MTNLIKDDYDQFWGVGSQIHICCQPLRVDTYQGCDHECQYCFSSFNHYQNVHGHPKAGDKFFKTIRTPSRRSLDKFINLLSIKKNDVKWDYEALIYKKQSLHVGGMSDPFQSIEVKCRSTQYLIEGLIEKNSYPAIFSTKGLIAADYANLLKKANSVVQISCVASDSLKYFETNAPSFDDRLEMAKILISNKIPVILRLQPFIWELKKESEHVLTEFCKIGVHAVVVEGLKKNSSLKNIDGLNQLTKSNFIENFVKKSSIRGKEYQYHPKIKLKYILDLKNIAKNYNVEFYVGDNDFRWLGDGPNCCGTTNLSGYENYNKLNMSTCVFKNEFSFSDFDNLKDDIFSKSKVKDVGLGTSAKLKSERHKNVYQRLMNFFNTNKTSNCLINMIDGVKAIGLNCDKNVIFEMMTLDEIIKKYELLI